MILLQEKVLSFRPEEQGLLKQSIGEPYWIPTVPHKPWQIKPISILAAIRGERTELAREPLKMGLYKQSCSSYSRPIFAVIKQDKKSLRIIHNLQQLNLVNCTGCGTSGIEELIDTMAGGVFLQGQIQPAGIASGVELHLG